MVDLNTKVHKVHKVHLCQARVLDKNVLEKLIIGAFKGGVA